MSHSVQGMLLPYPHPDSLVATRPALLRSQFEALVNALVRQLQAQPCARVGLWFEDAGLFSCALLGCWAAGVQPLLASDLLDDTRDWVNTEATLWISDQDIPGSSLPVLRLDALLVTPPPAVGLPDRQPANADAADPASSIFEDRAQDGLFLPLPDEAHAYLRTSGSTGAPGVIRKTFAQLHAEALTLIDHWSLRRLPATVIASVSHQHMYGLTFRIMVPLHAGLIMDRMQARYPETLAEQTQMHEQCIWITSPALLQRLPETLPWLSLLPRLSRVVSAGGTLSDHTRNKLLQTRWPLHEIYGSTETGIIATRHDQPYWTPFAGVVLETDLESRLAVSSPWAPERQQTADVISRSDDAAGFTLLGRADRILKLEDKRISLARIEQTALAHPYVSDIHCAPSPLGGRLCAMVELSPAGIDAFRQHGRRKIIKAISGLLHTAVDPLAIPRHWRLLAALPRNAQSKITRQQVQDCFTRPVRSPQWERCESDTETEASARQDDRQQTCTLTARIPPELVYFSGHFPSFPLVPGVVQLGWALQQARSRGLCQGDTQRIENLKFQQFLRPADACTMTLKWDNDKHKLYFSVRTGATMTASGRIAFCVSV